MTNDKKKKIDKGEFGQYKPVYNSNKNKEPAMTGNVVTYGKFKEGTKSDFDRIKKEASSAGILRRIAAQRQGMLGPISEMLKGLTAAEKLNKLKQINQYRKGRSSRGRGPDDKFHHIIDIIDPTLSLLDLDPEKPTVNELAIASRSPSISLKSAAVGPPTAVTPKTYTDSILEQKFGPDWKDKITDAFEDPYDEKQKWRWHDGFRSDGSAQVALEVRSEFVLGSDYTTTVIDTNRQFANDDKGQQEEGDDIKMLNDVPLIRWMKKMIDKFDRDCWFNYWGQGGLIQKWQYGRSLIIIQDDPKTGLPIALKLMNSMRLGRVFVDILTYKPAAVEYVDYVPPENIILAENMIYLVNKNFHNSPNTLWYGLSDYEVIRDVLETNILIEAIDIKEINKRLWAAMILIKVFSEDDEAIAMLRMALKAGKSVFSTLDFESQTVDIKHDLPSLLQERKDNREKIYGDLQVPRVVALGDTDALAKATASIAAHAWNAGPLKKHKLLVRTDFEAQWYDRNLMKLAKYRANILKIKPSEVSAHKDEIEKKMEEDIQYEWFATKDMDERELLIHLLAFPVVDWPFKLKMITTEIDFSTPIEKAALATTLKASQIIDTLKALEIMDYKDVIERMKADKTLDGQTTEVVKQLFNSGQDMSQLTVEQLLPLLMAAMRKGQIRANGKPVGALGTGPDGQPKPPTMEDIQAGIQKKAKGMDIGGNKLLKSVTNKAKLSTPDVGVTTNG